MTDMVGRDPHWIPCNSNLWKWDEGCFNTNRPNLHVPRRLGRRFAAQQVGEEETTALDVDDLHKRCSD
jgi:hypothetical protein